MTPTNVIVVNMLVARDKQVKRDVYITVHGKARNVQGYKILCGSPKQL